MKIKCTKCRAWWELHPLTFYCQRCGAAIDHSRFDELVKVHVAAEKELKQRYTASNKFVGCLIGFCGLMALINRNNQYIGWLVAIMAVSACISYILNRESAQAGVAARHPQLWSAPDVFRPSLKRPKGDH